MMEDRELLILHFRKVLSAHSAQCYRGYAGRMTDFEVILTFLQVFYVVSEQEDSI